MTIQLTGDPRKAGRIVSSRKTRDGGDTFRRSLAFDGSALNEQTLTVPVVFATSTPVKRHDAKGPYQEVLSMRGLRIQEGADYPLQLDHDTSSRSTVGRIHSVNIEGDKAVAQARFSAADDLKPIRQRVADGTLPHLSAGYVVHRWVESVDAKGVRTKTAVDWSLVEVSITPVPADPNSRIQRSNEEMDEDEVIELTPAQHRAEIRTIGRAAGMKAEDIDAMVDEDLTADEAKARAFEHMQTRRSPTIRVVTSHEDPAAIQTRAADALAFRMGGVAELPAASREFAAMSLLDLARDCLTRSGVSVRGLSVDEVFQRAAHGTSDFPLVVSNAANKTLLGAYQAAESPLKTIARQRQLPNFKESTSIRLGGMGRLEKLSEHGEITATSRAESGEKLSLATYARRFDLTRKLMIDDDTGAFGDIVAALGQAAAQTEADLLVSQLLSNPVMSDGVAVFHANHGNLSTGAALAETSLSDARLAMRQRKDLDGKTLISAAPKYLLVGPELETTAEKLLSAIQATRTDDVNPFAGKLSLLVEPRIDDDQWYVFADPARLAGLQYAYLSGAQGPQIQRQEMWDSLGVSFRVFEDFGAGWTDFRAAQKNPGA
ncbi:prohead protease/major capsid protein fusion protein [Mesorhizobium sp.]|uniref:prohead protease/major capsid protein fusion protein n=1 Tax=Mesorhizobium sp. TaxID=1871066 RepID=UPI0011FA779B|nr:prohead protease/major capsid protein fusion protein [Mesorhizobium sp.]TIS46184.1 MAG: peptidase [Mesorhizobium sp.]